MKRSTAKSPLRAPSEGPLIGAHMSVAGGLELGVERALKVKARALQIFTKNASRWKGKALAAPESVRFREALEASGLAPVAAHASYLINLASPDAALRKRSIEALADELRRADALGVRYVVLHPGAHMGRGLRAGCDRVAESIDRARRLAPAPEVIVLLETVAGQGTTIGRRFEELARIRERVERRDLTQFCLDTCHVHAAGYDIVSERGYEETFEEFDDVLGLETLRFFHVNDSKNERGSRVDRHEHIGRGKIGTAPFARILGDPRFHAVPKVLETPKGKDGVVMDRKNLALLRRLAEPPRPGNGAA
ncbi:MAG: deoxyribonuclease IV [Hyphomicrobiales bacterium]